MKIKCQYCGQILISNASFCSKCGKPIKNKLCAKCKTINELDAKYCINCGDKLETKKNIRYNKTKSDRKKLPFIFFGIFILVSALSIFIFLKVINLKNEKSDNTAVNQIKIDNKIINKINLLKENIKKNKNDVESYIELGNIFFDIDNKSEAILYYQKALEIDYTTADVRIDMAICYFESGDAETAISEIEKSLQFHPDHPNALYNLGIINYSIGRTKKAAQWWNKFLIVEPQGELSEKAKEFLGKITE